MGVQLRRERPSVRAVRLQKRVRVAALVRLIESMLKDPDERRDRRATRGLTRSMSGHARLVLGEGANAVRRQVGPTSWAASRYSWHSATETVEPLHRFATSAELGISKNTAHRAIRRLVDAGVVSPLQERSIDGRFLIGSYRTRGSRRRHPARPGRAHALRSHLRASLPTLDRHPSSLHRRLHPALPPHLLTRSGRPFP
ncbi:MAG: hypothetical protein R2705_14500 [Ilumatobacteraceae bacterium]